MGQQIKQCCLREGVGTPWWANTWNVYIYTFNLEKGWRNQAQSNLDGNDEDWFTRRNFQRQIFSIFTHHCKYHHRERKYLGSFTIVRYNQDTLNKLPDGHVTNWRNIYPRKVSKASFWCACETQQEQKESILAELS